MGQLIHGRLLVIFTLRFTCGERKISSTIKKSQNITNMLVGMVKDFPLAEQDGNLIKRTCILTFWFCIC